MPDAKSKFGRSVDFESSTNTEANGRVFISGDGQTLTKSLVNSAQNTIDFERHAVPKRTVTGGLSAAPKQTSGSSVTLRASEGARFYTKHSAKNTNVLSPTRPASFGDFNVNRFDASSECFSEGIATNGGRCSPALMALQKICHTKKGSPSFAVSPMPAVLNGYTNAKDFLYSFQYPQNATRGVSGQQLRSGPADSVFACAKRCMSFPRSACVAFAYGVAGSCIEYNGGETSSMPAGEYLFYVLPSAAPATLASFWDGPTGKTEGQLVYRLCEGSCESDEECDGNLVCQPRTGNEKVRSCSSGAGAMPLYGWNYCIPPPHGICPPAMAEEVCQPTTAWVTSTKKMGPVFQEKIVDQTAPAHIVADRSKVMWNFKFPVPNAEGKDEPDFAERHYFGSKAPSRVECAEKCTEWMDCTAFAYAARRSCKLYSYPVTRWPLKGFGTHADAYTPSAEGFDFYARGSSVDTKLGKTAKAVCRIELLQDICTGLDPAAEPVLSLPRPADAGGISGILFNFLQPVENTRPFPGAQHHKGMQNYVPLPPSPSTCLYAYPCGVLGGVSMAQPDVAGN